MNDVTCSFRVATVEGLKQYYVLMPADIKDAYLVQILDKYTEINKKSSIMIFTNTCKQVIKKSLDKSSDIMTICKVS